MKKATLLSTIFVLSVFLWSCGSNETRENDVKTTNSKTVKEKKAKMTVEKYCTIYKELDKLLMEKYWKDFKGKEYDEVKNIFAQYVEEEKAIKQKHDAGKYFSNFYSHNFKEIKEFRANDPEYIEYPEHKDALKTVSDFSIKKAMEDS